MFETASSGIFKFFQRGFAPAHGQCGDSAAHLLFAGDIIGHMPILCDASGGHNIEFDFSHIYSDAAKQLSAASYAVANLESPLGGGPYSGYPCFNSPDALAAGAMQAGIRMFSTANNHAFDAGITGAIRTLDVLDAMGAAHIGTHRSVQERSQNHGVHVADVDGISVAFLSYTQAFDFMPDTELFCDHINVFSSEHGLGSGAVAVSRLMDDMSYARSLGTDFIAVLLHWGKENCDTPNASQTAIAKFLVFLGADIVIGNHPHVLQPYGIIRLTGFDGKERSGFVSFSLGNFISNQGLLEERTTCVLDLSLQKGKKAFISDVSYTPYYMYFLDNAPFGNEAKPWGAQRFLLNVHEHIEAYESGSPGRITDDDYSQLIRALEHCHHILGKDGDAFYSRR